MHNFQDFITAEGDKLTTESRMVASVFNKRHDNVVRDLEKLREQLPAERLLNFEEISYLDQYGREHRGYRITRDGFMLLAKGFTGKKALGFKLAYIKAFNAMATYIQNQREGLQYKFLAAELEFKQEKQKISGHARELRKWQDTKPEKLAEMDGLLQQLQPSLLLN